MQQQQQQKKYTHSPYQHFLWSHLVTAFKWITMLNRECQILELSCLVVLWQFHSLTPRMIEVILILTSFCFPGLLSDSEQQMGTPGKVAESAPASICGSQNGRHNSRPSCFQCGSRGTAQRRRCGEKWQFSFCYHMHLNL